MAQRERYYVVIEHHGRLRAARMSFRDDTTERSMAAAEILAGGPVEGCTIAHWRDGYLVGRWTAPAWDRPKPFAWDDMHAAIRRSRKKITGWDVSAHLRARKAAA